MLPSPLTPILTTHSKQPLLTLQIIVRSFAVMLCLLIPTASAWSLTDAELSAMEFVDEATYIVRLNNADMLSGPIVETSSDAGGAYIRIGASIGRAKIYAKEIAWIGTSDQQYRHRHRGFLMPTAQPIRNDHFASLIEGIFPYIGAGIGDMMSITAGRTLIPGLPWSDQVSVINAKVTVSQDENGLVEDGFQYYALGANVGWLNDVNFMAHLYGVATWTGKRTQASTMFFAKVAGEDAYVISAGSIISPFGFVYSNGTIGAALSLDTRFPEFHDLHFVGELWAQDLTKPANTMLYLGLRTANTAVAMDFGLSIVPGPMVFPLVAFAWTPFK